VDEYGGELAASTFLHIWLLPLIPTGSTWISPTATDPVCLPTRWHWRSIFAGYLRTWVPLAWWFCFAVDSVAGYIVAAGAIALCAWSWSWRFAHRRNIQLRSDFDLTALGTQCPPEHLLVVDAKPLFEIKQADFAAVANDQTPEDIARFGSANLEQLLAAYAMLRLASNSNLPTHPTRGAVQRIITGKFEKRDAVDGVYRQVSDETPILTAESLAASVKARALKIRATTFLRAVASPKTWVQAIMWGSWQRLLGYAVLAMAFLGGASGMSEIGHANRFQAAAEAFANNKIADDSEEVDVQCDALTGGGLLYLNSDKVRIYTCEISGRRINVIGDAGRVFSKNEVRGRLVQQRLGAQDASTKHLDINSPNICLVASPLSKLGQVILATSFWLGALLLGLLWERVRRQRNSMIANARAALQG
jgi:hypothetical protein